MCELANAVGLRSLSAVLRDSSRVAAQHTPEVHTRAARRRAAADRGNEARGALAVGNGGAVKR